MKVIALANQKGGVGKTTTTMSLGIALAQMGKKVLLVDADSQGNLTQVLGWRRPDDLENTLSSLMGQVMQDKPIRIDETILHHDEGVDLIPSNLELASTDISLVNVMSRETVLRQCLDGVRKKYDYALIDCMPSLGMITINALTAADSVIIPVQAHYLPASGLERLLQSVARVKKQLNKNLKVDGILLTMVDNRTNFAKDITETIRNVYGSRVFKTEIPHSIRMAEMTTTGESIFKYEPGGKTANAYQMFAKEVDEIEKQRQRIRADFVR